MTLSQVASSCKRRPQSKPDPSVQERHGEAKSGPRQPSVRSIPIKSPDRLQLLVMKPSHACQQSLAESYSRSASYITTIAPVALASPVRTVVSVRG
jgi:hypothetical protein